MPPPASGIYQFPEKYRAAVREYSESYARASIEARTTPHKELAWRGDRHAPPELPSEADLEQLIEHLDFQPSVVEMSALRAIQALRARVAALEDGMGERREMLIIDISDPGAELANVLRAHAKVVSANDALRGKRDELLGQVNHLKAKNAELLIAQKELQQLRAESAQRSRLAQQGTISPTRH